jgi:hypothetical protein
MTCAVSCCVCMATVVRTASARSANAFSSSRTADSLAVDGDHQPAAGLHGLGPEPGAEDPVERIGADQGERAGRWIPPPARGPGPRRPGPPGRHRRPAGRSWRTTSSPRSPPRSRRRAARPARAGDRASSAGREPGQGDRAGTDCGQPGQAKMSSAGRGLSRRIRPAKSIELHPVAAPAPPSPKGPIAGERIVIRSAPRALRSW